jgi:hypothetical protein
VYAQVEIPNAIFQQDKFHSLLFFNNVAIEGVSEVNPTRLSSAIGSYKPAVSRAGYRPVKKAALVGVHTGAAA